MEILPLGHASFRLRGKQATVICDPYESAGVGLRFPKSVEADIVTVSHSHKDHSEVKAVSGTPYVISGPGEYEVKGVSVIGLSTFHDSQKGAERGKNTVYRIEIDGVRVVHLGDLGHTLSSEEVDRIDGVDVLFVPVGGYHTLDAKMAVSVISEIEPRIIIPMHYQREGLSPAFFDHLAPVSQFLKEIGKEGITPLPKLSVSKDKLPAEVQVVVLE